MLKSINYYCRMANQLIHFFFFLKVALFFFFNFIYLFLAVLGLRFRVRAFSSCGKRGPLFIVVRGPLTIEASLVAEHRLQTRRLSNCGSRAYLLRGMWELPRPGLEPVSLHWQADSQPLRHQGSPQLIHCLTHELFDCLGISIMIIEKK